MAQINGREIVLETLLLITRDGEYSHIALKNVLEKYQYLEKKERAFITRVVEGTLERMIEVDHIINCFSKVKTGKMKPVIRTILRSGVYQLIYMDSVPDSAVCNEAVKLAAKKGFVNLKGFVNGVLRTISREKGNIPYPGKDDMTAYLSVKYSLPEWIVRQWLPLYGADAVEKIGEEFLKEKAVTVRCNTQKISPGELKELLTSEGVKALEVPGAAEAFYLSGYDHLAALETFQKGYFYVQDVSSMQVAHWAAPAQGDFVLDVCAAPGGKALHAAELLSGTGMVQARDLTDYKVGLLWENIERSGLENIEAVKWDASVPDESMYEKADIVIADLPCSGLGVLGKKPDLKYKMTEEMQESLVNLQRQILDVIHRYVKPGGKLLYSTCTICRKENEENAAWFAGEHPEFTLVKEEQRLPGREAGDGFYIAMFQKEKR